MVYHDEIIPKKRKVTNQPKNCKSKHAHAYPSENGHNYGIEHLNIGKAVNYLEGESK